MRDDPAGPDLPPAPWKKLTLRALSAFGVLVFFAALGVGMWEWQQYCAPPGEKRPSFFSSWHWPAPTPPPAPPPPPPDPGTSCMTSRTYERLQRLPPYGVVKPGSELDTRIRNSARPSRGDGGS